MKQMGLIDDHKEVYDELFDHAIRLMNDESKSPEMVAGTMMAIAQRIYKTQLDEDEYEEMMDVMRDAPVTPYIIKKERIH
tara:strand:- start:45 stop:284 length:240 start_codon:yes stop_codon:yes gene_type:complete